MLSVWMHSNIETDQAKLNGHFERLASYSRKANL